MARIGLVLGAGGIVGHAFHAGVLAALAEATGWDPREAEVIVGTSAGSVVGALVRAGMSAEDHYARVTGAPLSAEGARLVEQLGPPQPMPAFPGFGWPWMASPETWLRAARRPWTTRPGVLLAATLPAGRIPTEQIALGLRRVYGTAWATRPLWVCAVRLGSGERVVFGRDGSPAAPLPDAVRASCAIPAFFEPVAIDGARYVDGGAWSATNLDVLAGLGLDLIVVSSPMSTVPGTLRLGLDVPARLLCHWRLVQERLRVRLGGTPVVAFEPGAEEQGVMGFDAMNRRKRRPVAEAARAAVRRRFEERALRTEIAALAG
jgi:NTE family protein